jgi:hypothetical protein
LIPKLGGGFWAVAASSDPKAPNEVVTVNLSGGCRVDFGVSFIY